MFGFHRKKAEKAPSSLRHIAFIMDGNGRWASKKGMPREYGHSVGAQTFEKIAQYCGDIGIEYITVYAFSTENWKRPEREVGEIMRLFREYLKRARDNFVEKDMRIRIIGDTQCFDAETKALIEEIEVASAKNRKKVNIAMNYGGRQEIVSAVNKLIASGADSVTEDDIECALYTAGIPEPDLIVRTGNEKRTSNFLMWQSAYSELYFTETLWPDMTCEDVDRAISDFSKRKRRYGGI